MSNPSPMPPVPGPWPEAWLLHRILDALPDLVWLKAADGTYLECNERFERLYGVGRVELLGRTDFDFLDAPQARAAQERDRKAIRAGGATLSEEAVTFRRDGHRELLETIKLPLRDPDGELLGVLGVGRNVARHRRREVHGRPAGAPFLAAFDRLPLLVALSRLADGRFIEVNETCCQALGYDREELLGRTSVEIGLLAPEVRERIPRALESTSVVRDLELEGRTKDGRLIPCLFSGQCFRLGGEELLLSVVTDLRERHRTGQSRRDAEPEQHQAQKLESLGSLAGGVAHDMNNILAAIQAVSETLHATRGGDPAVARCLGLIDTAAARGRDLVRSLTDFTRKEARLPEPVDLNGLLEEEAQLLSRTTLQKVRLDLDLEPNLPPVLGERSTLAGAIMNLAVNAVDAMPGGGTLTLRTRSLPDGQLEVQVQDTGVGMDPGVLARALEPFFTTKPVGRGTGLGLSLAYATVQAHGGSFAMHSAPGQGTTVTLGLPAAGEPLRAESVPETPACRPRRVLLVDDDPLIQAALPGVVVSLGHEVEVAPGGREALDRLESGWACDLIILDQNMPGWSGIETLAAVRRRWPELPVILATGLPDAATEAALAGDPWAFSLHKPFSRADLAGKLAEIDAVEHP